MSHVFPIYEVKDIIDFSKHLIIQLDVFREYNPIIKELQKSLTRIEKSFLELNLKINENDTLLSLNRIYMNEALDSIDSLRECLSSIMDQCKILESHHSLGRQDVLTAVNELLWNFLNSASIMSTFEQFNLKINAYADHLLIAFLPILNDIINNSFEREKACQHIRTLTAHDKEKIRMLCMMDNHIMKVYVPKEAPIEPPKTTLITEQDISSYESPANAKSDGNTAVCRTPSSESVSDSTALLKVNSKEEGENDIRNTALFRRRLTRGSSISRYDIHHDYYHVRWLQVLSLIWNSGYPDLTLGQIKYIYLSNPFFLELCQDPYFVNDHSLTECSALQLYLESIEEIPALKQSDYEYVAELIHQNHLITMQELTQKLNERFIGKRVWNFLLVSYFFLCFSLLSLNISFL
jgi:dimeric dUTPase (all-alpha-NTP-PPase superfamily)